jgi:mRNA interferase HigB
MRRFVVRIISRKRIREACAKHSEWEASLAAWYRITKGAVWRNFPNVRQSWRNVDSVGTCVVFDISHNKCRLISYINYKTQKVFILHILTHTDYIMDGWKDDCSP